MATGPLGPALQLVHLVYILSYFKTYLMNYVLILDILIMAIIVFEWSEWDLGYFFSFISGVWWLMKSSFDFWAPSGPSQVFSSSL